MNLEQELSNFITSLQKKGRSNSTIIAYKKDIEQLIAYVQSNELSDYSQITSVFLASYIEHLKNSGEYTLKTISRKINSLKTFCKFLVAQKKLTKDPSTTVQHPKLKKQQPRILSGMEYRALRDTVRKNPRLSTMIEVLLQTGIRIGELSRMRIEDIHLTANPKYLSIREYSSNPERTIELNDTVIESLTKYISDTKGFLFTTKSGKAVLIRNIRTAINRAFTKTGIKNVTVNDIRNTFIVHQLNNGMDVEVLAKIVGHKKPTTTERYLELASERNQAKSKVTEKITTL